MKKYLQLIASVDKPEMLGNIFEQLATCRYVPGYGNAAVP